MTKKKKDTWPKPWRGRPQGITRNYEIPLHNIIPTMPMAIKTILIIQEMGILLSVLEDHGFKLTSIWKSWGNIYIIWQHHFLLQMSKETCFYAALRTIHPTIHPLLSLTVATEHEQNAWLTTWVVGPWRFAIVFSSFFFFCLHNYVFWEADTRVIIVSVCCFAGYICYSPPVRSVQGRTMAEGTVFLYTNRPRPANDKFIFSVFFFLF